MAKDKSEDYEGRKWHKQMKGGSATGAVYGLGLLGAAVYFLQHANSFWGGILGILKAIIWPALLIYQLLGFLKM